MLARLLAGAFFPDLRGDLVHFCPAFTLEVHFIKRWNVFMAEGIVPECDGVRGRLSVTDALGANG